MSFKQNNPLSRKTSPINKNWIKGAIKRPGAFKKKAEEAGMSTKAFAEKVTSNKDNYDARTGKQAELAETLMGMSRDSFTMEELNKDSKKQKAESKKQADKLPQIEKPGFDYEMDQDMSYPGGERGRDYDEDGLKDLKKDGMSRHTSEHSTEEYMARKDAAIKKSKGVSRKSAFGDVGKNLKTSVRSKGSVVEKATPKSKEQSIADGNKKADKASKSVSDFKSKIDKQAADTKGKKTAKDAGKVDKSGRDGSNRQERQKRRAERKSIRKDKTLSSSQKKMAKRESRQKQKENVRGVKK